MERILNYKLKNDKHTLSIIALIVLLLMLLGAYIPNFYLFATLHGWTFGFLFGEWHPLAYLFTGLALMKHILKNSKHHLPPFLRMHYINYIFIFIIFSLTITVVNFNVVNNTHQGFTNAINYWWNNASGGDWYRLVDQDGGLLGAFLYGSATQFISVAIFMPIMIVLSIFASLLFIAGSWYNLWHFTSAIFNSKRRLKDPSKSYHEYEYHMEKLKNIESGHHRHLKNKVSELVADKKRIHKELKTANFSEMESLSNNEKGHPQVINDAKEKLFDSTTLSDRGEHKVEKVATNNDVIEDINKKLSNVNLSPIIGDLDKMNSSEIEEFYNKSGVTSNDSKESVGDGAQNYEYDNHDESGSDEVVEQVDSYEDNNNDNNNETNSFSSDFEYSFANNGAAANDHNDVEDNYNQYNNEDNLNNDYNQYDNEVESNLSDEALVDGFLSEDNNDSYEEGESYDDDNDESDYDFSTRRAKELSLISTNEIDFEDSYKRYNSNKLSHPDNNRKQHNAQVEWSEKHIETLNELFDSFKVKATANSYIVGPTVTKFLIHPSPGVLLNKISNLKDNLKLILAAKTIRIEAPIPGTSFVGIEVPNVNCQTVTIKEVITNLEIDDELNPLAIGLGKDISGKIVVLDISKAPHLLIAGATGSGKSVCINGIISSILMKATPEQVRLILIDPKKVELTSYEGVPHLLSPIINDPEKAAYILDQIVVEMEERYQVMAQHKVRNIDAYNKLAETEGLATWPSIVIVIDELSDLMVTSSKEVEKSIIRITQKARASGIHLIVSTQRPSTNVITGLIKANLPSRIAFAVSSQVDSRTIIDFNGAETLIGNGDMLFSLFGKELIRVQGTYISDDEIDEIIEFSKEQGDPQYNELYKFEEK